MSALALVHSNPGPLAAPGPDFYKLEESTVKPETPLPTTVTRANPAAPASLPFKGRAGVGMGEDAADPSPIPLLTSPLKGEEPGPSGLLPTAPAPASLPFKGRAGVGMGGDAADTSPIPLLTSPLKGEEPGPSALLATTPVPAATAVPAAARRDWSGLVKLLFLKVVPPVFGLALLIGIWHLATINGGSIPAPGKVWAEAVRLFADPFYQNGPNDQGIGWNILSSLRRVAIGFGLAALVGIPLGFIIGRFDFAAGMLNPIISLLRPVSPLAWLPIGLLVFKRADPAATYTIFICSIWPMIMNTAQGVQRIPADYLNVARVLNLSEWKIFTKILFPSVLPYMLTGIRLSIGTAWLVIVAAEMLTGGVGIGFWVWDEWNNLKVESIIIAIFVIGIVGLLLEQALVMVAKRFTYETR